MPGIATTVTASTTHEIRISPTLKRKLLTELKTYAELKGQIKVLEAAVDKHKASIAALHDQTGEQKIEVEGFKITLVSPVISKLDPKLLIANGVTMGQIEESTVTKPGKSYRKITLPGEQEKEY